MSVDNLLQHLNKVKRTGQSNWMACCPAHEDKTPSLSVRELDDGRVLVHCFAECAVENVLSAVGLNFDALYPARPIEQCKPERRPFPAADILRAIVVEVSIVFLAAKDISNGHQLTHEDIARLLVAAGRIQEALNAGMLNHGRY